MIAAGGDLNPADFSELLDGAYLIGADRGALYLTDSGYRVDLAVGDFDSVNEDEMERISANSGNVLKHPPEKDDTDLELAVKKALDMEGSITILGGTGSRMDQTFSAVDLLMICREKGREACIIDRNNRIRLITGRHVVRRSSYPYVSLYPFGEKEVTVSLSGFKYSGDNIVLKRGSSLGISNEIAGEEGVIKTDGILYLFESRD